jgi:hypothetical protein
MQSRDFEWDYAEDITPADLTDLDPAPVGLHVKTTAGLVEVEFWRKDSSGSTISEGVYIALGDYVKMKVRKVKSTGTGAAGIVGLYRSTSNAAS